MTTTPTMINGVDCEVLFGTIAAVKAEPTLAAFTFRLGNAWMQGGLNRSTISGFHGTNAEIAHETTFVIDNDEPAVLLSGDAAPNPVEHLLHALAGCLTTSLVYHAAARGMQIAAVRTRFEGDLDLRGFLGLSKSVRNGFSVIRVVFEIDGNLTADQKRELIGIAREFSPVYDMVTNGVPVTCALEGDMAEAA